MASIPMSVQMPQFQGPLQNLSQLLQAKDLASQIGMRQAQTQQATQQSQLYDAEAQQKQRDLADQNTLQEAMRDPAQAAKLHTGDFSSVEGRIQPRTLDAVRKNQLEYENTLLAHTETQNKVRRDALGELNTAVTGLLGLTDDKGQPDLGKINGALPGTVQNLASAGVLKNAGIDPSKIPQTISDPAQLQSFLATTGGAIAAHDKALAQQEASAKGRKETAEAGIKEGELKAIQGETSQDAAHKVAGIVDPAKNAARYSAYLGQYLSAPTLEAKTAVLHQAQEEMGGIAKATNPDIIRADVNKAVAVERATAPIKQANAIAEAKALRSGDNPAVANVPPAAVAAVQNHAIKLDEDYLKAKSATESLGHILDLAESGNKEAGSNLPLVGVETVNAINGIKRINSAEISQYGNAGSLLDQIKGKIGKIVEGKPIPQDVLNDIRELHQALGQQSYQTYTDSLKSLNERTGAKYQPAADAPSLNHKPIGAGGQVPQEVKSLLGDRGIAPGTHTLSDGSRWLKNRDGSITQQ